MLTSGSPATLAPPPLRAPEPASRTVRAEAIATLAALEALRPEWERLWRLASRATPFQSPHWLLPWWRHVGRGRLASVAVRCANTGELVGLAPLYVHTDPATGRRHLFPLGMATTDELDWLVRDGWEDPVLQAVFAQLADAQETFDVLEIPQLRADSPLLRAPLPASWESEVAPGEPSPLLALRPAAAIPRSTRANLRTARNRAARAGALRYETAAAPAIAEFLEALARLHARRWNASGEAGVLADPAVRAMHSEAAPLLHAAGLLRLHGLRLDGALVAVLYVLADPAGAHERRHAYYIGGFDPRHAALSPGTLLVAHAIEQAAADGASAFDFLRGAEPYKYRWGALDQPMFTLRAWPQAAAHRTVPWPA